MKASFSSCDHCDDLLLSNSHSAGLPTSLWASIVFFGACAALPLWKISLIRSLMVLSGGSG